MKNRHEFLRIMILLPLLLFVSTGVYTQLAKDPRRDLSVSFSLKQEGSDPGSVFGVVTNKSANAYPCVRIEFDLYTPFDLLPTGQVRLHLGVLPVEVQNVSPRTGRNYQQPLPFPAAMLLKSVSECPKPMPDAPEILSFTVAPPGIQAGQTATLQWSTANTAQVFVGERNPEWPRTSSEPILAPRGFDPSGSWQVSPSQTVTYRLEAKKEGKSTFKDVTVEVTSAPPPPATCSITGQIKGPLRWKTEDDLGQHGVATLTHIIMKAPGVTQTMRAQIRRDGTYIFENVPAGKTYKIFPDYFRSQPEQIEVQCQPNKPNPGKNFKITGPPRSG